HAPLPAGSCEAASAGSGGHAGGGPSGSQHESHVGATRRVREEDVLQLLRRDAQANGGREEVDDLVGARAEQVGAEDLVRAFLDQHLEAGGGLANTARVEPPGGVLVVGAEP